MRLKLNGKKILFFGPKTFNYENEIVAELERLGAQVVYRGDKPSNSFFLKAILRLFPRIIWSYSDRVFGQWLSVNGPVGCDIVFVVKGEGLSPRFVDVLRKKYTSAKFIPYLWDSVNNIRNVNLKFSRFDHLYSFDPNDCEQYAGLKYRPLFFLERYLSFDAGEGRGCFFIGTLNGDRPAVISRLIGVFAKDIEFNYWLFVRSKFELFFRRFIDSKLRLLDQSRLITVPMSSEVVRQHFRRSAVIVDIEHQNQIGLTMLTFEVLASGKKLITTNNVVNRCEFYHPSRICVIDRDNPIIDMAFVNSRMVPLPASFYERYSLRGWLLEIFACMVPEGDG